MLDVDVCELAGFFLVMQCVGKAEVGVIDYVEYVLDVLVDYCFDYHVGDRCDVLWRFDVDVDLVVVDLDRICRRFVVEAGGVTVEWVVVEAVPWAAQ